MEQLEHKVKKDIDQGPFNLVKGDFTPEDAFEIMNHLIQEKINFHQRRSFSQEIRFGSKDAASLKRVDELLLDGKSIKNLIQEAKANGKTLRIKSNVSIELI